MRQLALEKFVIVPCGGVRLRGCVKLMRVHLSEVVELSAGPVRTHQDLALTWPGTIQCPGSG